MEYLIGITVRSVLLAALAGLALWICRVKSPSVRHAVWTLVTSGMLLQAVLIPWLPAVGVPVLRPVPVVVSPNANIVDNSSTVVTGPPPTRRPSVSQVIVYAYCFGALWSTLQLVYAGWFTLRLARESIPLGGRRYESPRISVPVTVGRRILLPPGWREWDAGKLAAVLAHEEAHVARWDWAVAAMARVNRCVFWFHPQAWWLERSLARLAEQICDDAALSVVTDREAYASVLMDMVRTAGARGRLVFGTVAMAKETNMEIRINRILDESMGVTKKLGRIGWLGLTVCGTSLVYLAAVVQLAPGQSTAAIPSRELPVAAPKAAAPEIVGPEQPRLVAQAAAPRAPRALTGDNAVGSLSGAVADPNGARIPMVVVGVRGPSGNFTTTANAVGEWAVPALPVGTYSLEISVPGFVANRRSGIEVAAGANLRIDTNLILGSTQETVTIRAAGNPRPAAGPARSGALPVRIGGNVQAASRTKNVDPVYPQSARDQGVTGPVVIQAVIGKSGTVINPRVINNPPYELVAAALAAVQNWEYVPALLDGEPVETLTTITINFQLEQQ